ncbi:MAG: hypothetical protein IBJ10_08145 [Phycisphaerales bacterium]|nr:hypothetical protein [Phycisphaerales bacterium]
MTALAAACICAPALGWRALSNARAELSAASTLHGETIANARKLDGLSRRRAVLSDQPRPEPDLVSRIGAQMSGAGLDPAQVSRVNVSAPQPVGDGALRRQTAGVTMSLATPGDLARWLSAWSVAEPAWTVVSVRLDRAGRSSGPPYTAALTLESLHRSDAPAAANSAKVRP